MKECGLKLEPSGVTPSEQEKQSRDADNRRKHTNDKGASMPDAFMLIGIRTTLTDSQVFQVTSHIVGLVVLCVLGCQFTCCQCNKLIHF